MPHHLAPLCLAALAVAGSLATLATGDAWPLVPAAVALPLATMAAHLASADRNP